MLLDNLLEARVVELGEACQVMHVGNDVAQILLEQVESLVGLVGERARLLRTGNRIADLLLRRGNAPDNLLALDALERVDLVEFLVEQLQVVLLRGLVPSVVDTQRVLQALVVNVVKDPLLVERLLKLLAEPVRVALAPVDVTGAVRPLEGRCSAG
jgi:hypothetical protein